MIQITLLYIYLQIAATPWTWSCNPNPASNGNSNQHWSFIGPSNQVITNLSVENFEIQSYESSTYCITATDIGTSYTTLPMKACSRNRHQLFKYNSETNQISLIANETMCVTQKYQLEPDANCSVEPYSTYPYCDQGVLI